MAEGRESREKTEKNRILGGKDLSLGDWKAEEKLIRRISAAIRSGSVSHAYIIEGDTQTDKEAFARDFLKALCCDEKPGIGCDRCVTCRKIAHDNSEDLYIVRAEGLSVKDKDISLLQENLKTKPAGERNMAIIADADTMTVRAQNRLLKTLEEPPGNAVILLLSNNKENLLQTIRSRCISYRIGGFQTTGQKYEAANAVIDALLENEKFFYLKQILSGYVKNREDALKLLDGMEIIYRNFVLGDDERGRLIKSESVFSYIDLIEEARRDIIANVNYNYAIKNMIIKIGGIYG